MRWLVALLSLVCSASVAWAQSAPPQTPPQQAPAPQQPQEPPSAWKAQFSGENWSLQEIALEPGLVVLRLKMNRFYSGGAGEARLIFERRAQVLTRAGDFAAYQIVNYSESLNSFLFGGQRIAEGTIRLIPKM